MPAKRPVSKTTLFFILALLIPLVLLLAVAEIVARYFDPEIRLREGLKNPFWAHHATRHHALKPGDYSDTIWGISFHVNSLGFRGPEISKQKKAGVTRILCAGDSITMGSALPDEATYPRVLEDMLNEKYPGRGFEVINAGISGYDIEEEYLLLKEDGLALSPDAVVLQFCLNDVPGVAFADLINPNLDIPLPGGKFMLENLALARFLKERYNRIGLKNTFMGLAGLFEMDPSSPEAQRIESGWREYEKKLGEMASLCRNRGIGFMLVIVPHAAQFEDRQQRFIPQRRLKSFAVKNGFACLDLAPLFSSLQELPYSFPDPVHPDPVGHEIIAKAILEWIEETGTVRPEN